MMMTITLVRDRKEKGREKEGRECINEILNGGTVMIKLRWRAKVMFYQSLFKKEERI